LKTPPDFKAQFSCYRFSFSPQTYLRNCVVDTVSLYEY